METPGQNPDAHVREIILKAVHLERGTCEEAAERPIDTIIARRRTLLGGLPGSHSVTIERIGEDGAVEQEQLPYADVSLEDPDNHESRFTINVFRPVINAAGRREGFAIAATLVGVSTLIAMRRHRKQK